MNTVEFLTSLYSEISSDQYLYLWTLPDRKTHLFSADQLASMAAAADKLSKSNHDVYFGVGMTKEKLAYNKRPLLDMVSGIPGIWVDIDVFHPTAHKANNLPQDYEAAMSLLPENLPPTTVVWSGYGLHAYWQFKEAWEFDAPEESNRATALLRAVQGVVRSKAAAKGWKVDPTADLSRVLRLPGTLNFKIKESPALATVIHTCETYYNPSDIEDILPPAEETPAQPLGNARTFERRDTDKESSLMTANCQYLQYCRMNPTQINYAEWLAALTNLARAADGQTACHEFSKLDSKRYDERATELKITEALKMAPQTCNYIRTAIGYKGCPEGGCGMQAPSAWSLSKLGQAKATIRAIPLPDIDTVSQPEVLGALAVLKKEDPTEYARFRSNCKGRINLNDLERMVSKNKPVRLATADDKPAKRMLSSTVSDIPLDLRLPVNFRFELSGIMYVKENSNGDLMTYKATGTPVIVSKRLANIDTCQEKVEVSYMNLGHWHKAVFTRSRVIDSRKVLELSDYGISVSSESSKHLVRWFDALIDDNQDLIPVVRSVGKLGWRDSGEFVFPTLPGSFELDLEGEGVSSSISGFNIAGDRSEWMGAMLHMRQYPLARFILSASFAAPLLKILGQRNFIIHNWGDTQGGKTATQWAAMSVWGDPNKIIGTFDMTSTGIERKAALHCDLPLGINEREVMSKNKKSDISPLLYILAEGKGRQRGTKTGLQDMATWRTVALSTGEGTLSTDSSLAGVLTRTIEIYGGPLAADSQFAKSLYYILPKTHGHAGAEYLTALMQSDYRTIYGYYEGFRRQLAAACPDQIDSHVDACACIATADYLSSGWIFGEDWTQSQITALQIAQGVLAGLPTKADASEAERAWVSFVDWLAEHDHQFNNNAIGPKLGYREHGALCIIRRVVNEWLDENFSNSRKIIKDWAEGGKIKPYQETGRIKYDHVGKAMEGGVRPRVIKLYPFGKGD